jgi:hypothetical protein
MGRAWKFKLRSGSGNVTGISNLSRELADGARKCRVTVQEVSFVIYE